MRWKEHAFSGKERFAAFAQITAEAAMVVAEEKVAELERVPVG
jgi:hypothetical protein